MSLRNRFTETVLESFRSVGNRTGVLPNLIARACVQLLPVTGAVLSFRGTIRIPLGASDPVAAHAESLEITLGEGPSIAVGSAHSYPPETSGPNMADRWPLFHRELLRQTPYRSVATFPLQSQDRDRLGTLHLYAEDEAVFTSGMFDQIAVEVADPITALLFNTPQLNTPQFTASPPRPEETYSPPAWLASDAVIARMNVWIAVGQLMEVGVLTDDEALAILRGFAFARNITLDDLALQLTTRQLSPEAVLRS